MLRTTLFLVFLYAVTCQTIFSANLSGNQITPTAATTEGEGSGEFELDPDSLDLSYDIAFDYIESGITASHIHGPAREGANAAVLYTLTVTEGETEGSLKGSVKLTSAHVTQLKQGLLYVVVHSTDFPDGEIRGQIFSTTKYYKAELKGEFEVPPVDSKASGDATFTIDFETSSIEYDLSHSVKDITAIHFHGPAEVGATAAVIAALDDLAAEVSGTLTLTPQELGYFRAGLMYINVHSTAHPDGEIRGQIVADEDSNVVGWTIAGVLFAGFVALVVIAIIAAVIAALVLAYKKSDSIKEFIQKKRGAPTPSLSTDRVSGAPLLADHTYL